MSTAPSSGQSSYGASPRAKRVVKLSSSLPKKLEQDDRDIEIERLEHDNQMLSNILEKVFYFPMLR